MHNDCKSMALKNFWLCAYIAIVIENRMEMHVHAASASSTGPMRHQQALRVPCGISKLYGSHAASASSTGPMRHQQALRVLTLCIVMHNIYLLKQNPPPPPPPQPRYNIMLTALRKWVGYKTRLSCAETYIYVLLKIDWCLWRTQLEGNGGITRF